MPFGGLLTLGGIGLAGSIGGSLYQGMNAQSIAQQQLASQQQQQQQALGYANNSIAAAAPTMQELQAMDQELSNMTRTYSMQQASLSRDTSLLSSIDPAFISAGQQAYQLMNGQSAPVLGPLQTQLDTQRKQLTSQLQQQYGPGWADSSAGIQAMQNFNNSANLTLSQAQQSYTGQLLGAAGSYAPNLTNDINSSANTMGSLGSSYVGQNQAQQGLQIQANGQAVQALTATNPTQYQGAGNIGGLQAGQMIGGIGSSLTGMAAGMAGQSYGQSQFFNNLQNYQNTMGTLGSGGGGGGGASYYSATRG